MSQQPFPTLDAPVVNSRGILTVGWAKLFQALWQRTGGITPNAPIASLTPATSPWTYTATANGEFVLSGGTVSAVSFARSPTTISAGQTSGMFRMLSGDQLTITYSATPTASFVPMP